MPPSFSFQFSRRFKSPPIGLEVGRRSSDAIALGEYEMFRSSSSTAKIALAAFAIAAATVAGCGGGGGYGGGSMPPGPQPSASAVPSITIVLFARNVGSVNDPTFGTVQGFTQTTNSQVLGLAPGQQIMLKNGDSVANAFNVYSAYPTPPPPGGTLDTSASGTTTLAAGYRSGPIAPGMSVGPLTVTNSAGNLFIACAFHFGSNGMQDGMIVNVGATPGPQATGAGGASPPPCHYYC
jgi:hypothetical protein